MKLEIARGLFLVAALGVATAAVAAWEEPGPVFFSHAAAEQCPLPRLVKSQVTASPDHDLLLFLFGMSQGLRPQS
ncbi:hypothetical protein IIE18_27420 [Pseudomonas sp. V1]|uniref:hypothetical protein n=1 Tax=Pseudomonas arcuscaelestis TaxID=2710591 RepID=UPI00193F00BD|nr:hypothetical protein [Pseudomonas arcuscaelestis]MBM3108854.1 hypothetical protein [Pseudomonas arcuscaelestis]